LSPICSATAAPGIARDSNRAIPGRSAEEPQRGDRLAAGSRSTMQQGVQ
jgi:hypothetical protein